MSYPAHYHDAMAALIRAAPGIRGTVERARLRLAVSLRIYRQAGDWEAVQLLREKAAFIGWPIRERPNGRFS